MGYAMSGTAARVLTAVVLIPLVVWLVLWGPTWLVAIVVAGIILLALHEFFALGAKMNMPGYPKFTMVCALVLVIVHSGAFYDAIMWAPLTSIWPSLRLEVMSSPQFVFAVLVVGLATLALASRRELRDALPSGAVSAAAILFIALPLSYIVRLHAVTPIGLLFVLVLVWVGDTAAFFAGRGMGKRLLAPAISPKKTWEGAGANLLGSLATGLVFSRWLDISLVHCLSAAVLVSVVGQMGDLFESAWKRGAGVKDSGALLPGHGGILDRIDALLLAVPVFWWYFSIFPWLL